METETKATHTPDWALKGRDGEPVTLLQKLEQSMEFGSAMERLAIENNARANEQAELIVRLCAAIDAFTLAVPQPCPISYCANNPASATRQQPCMWCRARVVAAEARRVATGVQS